MQYDVIFRDVVSSILRDYAGYDEKKLRHDSMYFSAAFQKAQQNGQLDDVTFMQMMNQYLVLLQDRNLKFRLSDSKVYQAGTCGFYARSYQGKLYVTRADQEKRVNPGDQLITLNMTPPALAKKRFEINILGDDVEEREIWAPILKMTTQCMVKHTDGTDENLTLKKYPISDKLPKLGGRMIGKDTLYLDLPHFMEDGSLDKLLASKEKSLGRCRKLILDLRYNIGGSEMTFIPLLDYIFPEPVLLRELYEDQGLYTNYTETNCRRKGQMLEGFLANAPRGSKTLVKTMIKELKTKSGQGMTWELDEDLAADETIVGGKGNFEKVIILSDTYCEFAGETFIQLCKKSPKVTVIGRPTMGNVDYCNPISVLYNGVFTFTYPMSKTKAAMEGKGVSGKGVPVDVYVPWTPAECTADILLTRACMM